MHPDIQEFILAHENDDPYQISLAADLQKGWPVKEIAEQIQSRQKAKKKMPGWLHQPGIIFPPSLAVEQASSEITAQFKSSIFKGDIGIDLTGGTGIDSYYLSKTFTQFHYVEKNKLLLNLARHNFKTLQQGNVEFHHNTAEEFLKSYQGRADLIYLDPSRRVQGKVFRLQDSEPNVLDLVPDLLEKGRHLLVKSSPLQDVQEVLKHFSQIAGIYIIAVQNDCKEVLYWLSGEPGKIKITCINFLNDSDRQEFVFMPGEESATCEYSLPQSYLYEPNVSILKAGAFKSIAIRFNIFKLHPNSHLYTSEKIFPEFPGRIFRIENIYPFNTKCRKQLPAQLNIITRNFPATVGQIANKMKIVEGGEQYLIATTLQNNEKRLLYCTRLQ